MYSKSLLKSHGWDERAHTVWKVGDVLSDGYWVLGTAPPFPRKS